MKFFMILELKTNIENMLAKVTNLVWWEDADDVEAYCNELATNAGVFKAVMQSFLENFKSDSRYTTKFIKQWNFRMDTLFAVISLQLDADIINVKNNLYPDVEITTPGQEVFELLVRDWLLSKSDFFKAFIPQEDLEME